METLAVESTAVILSAAIAHFDFSPSEDLNEEFGSLVGRSLYVKLDSKIQAQQYNRAVDKSTLEWWAKQGEFVRDLCFKPSKQDLNPMVAMQALREYINKHSNGERNIIWTRGSLDQMVTDSLCKAIGIDTLAHYSDWRDVRTAVDLLAESSNNGYCQLSRPFNRDLAVKHIPTHDIALDILMLKYPK